jgi:methylase of polypeptide subunit release factors
MCRAPDPSFAPAVRRVLDAAGYDEQNIGERLGTGSSVVVAPRDRPRLLRCTREGTPLDALIRLFLLGADVDEDATRRAIAPTQLATWCDAGLLASSQGRVSAQFTLTPQLGLLLLFDRHASGPPLPDHVLGLGPASRELAWATVRAPVERALDLGTGCGGQALLLASHVEQIIATDVNPRALAIAAFNAGLNGIGHVSFRTGSLFEPVAGERFDLIVANPPFAIGPDRGLVYRDGGLATDGFVAQLVREAPRHLRPGGLCQLTAHWAQHRGKDWSARLAAWAADSADGACDVWILRQRSVSPEHYAAGWITETEQPTPEAYVGRWEQWVDYLAREDVESLGVGLIQLRKRRAGPARVWVLDEVEDLGPEAGEAIAAGFEVRDALDACSEEALLELSLCLAAGVRLENVSTSRGEGWETPGALLHLRRGLHHSASVDGAVAGVVSRCNGERPLRVLVHELADSLGADLAAVTAALLPIVRGLMERGFLRLPPVAGPKQREGSILR